MRWRVQDTAQWHPVPYAWVPCCFESVAYWFEYPPYERRVKWEHVCGPFYEYRKVD